MFAKAITFTAIQILIGFGFLLFGNVNRSDHFLRAMHDKVELLDRHTERPRIILLGGSSFAFGVHSPMLENRFNRDVINLGLAGGLLTDDFLLRIVSDKVRPGDIIILNYEYPLFDLAPVDEKRQEFLEVNPELVSYFPNLEADRIARLSGFSSQHWRESLDKGVFSWIGDHVVRVKRHLLTGSSGGSSWTKDGFALYLRSGFNEYGDFISHYNEPETYWQKEDRVEGDRRKISELYAAYSGQASQGTVKQYVLTDQINSHCQGFVAAGATVYFVPQPIACEACLEQDAKHIATIWAMLTEATAFEILGSPMDTIYDSRWFYDTASHLGKEGGVVYTQFLIDQLASKISDH